MSNFDDETSDEDKAKIANFLNQKDDQQSSDNAANSALNNVIAQQPGTQARSDALRKFVTTPNPQIEDMAAGGMGEVGGTSAPELADAVETAVSYGPQALQKAKQAVNDAMTATNGAYWDPLVKNAQDKFNKILDLMNKMQK